MNDEQINLQITQILPSLKDADSEVRLKAVQKLGRLNHILTFEPLVEALGDEDFKVRGFAGDYLGRLGDIRAIEALTKALATHNWTPEANSAIGALVRFGELGQQALLKAIESDNWVTRMNAAHGLGWEKIKDGRSVNVLIKALEDENWQVRFHAIDSLYTVGDERAIEPLIKALGRETEENNAIQILLVLERLAGKGVMPQLLKRVEISNSAVIERDFNLEYFVKQRINEVDDNPK